MGEEYYYAIICEGSSEQAIIELLLERNLLFFKRTDLLEDRIIRVRSAKKFAEIYLRTRLSKPVCIYRILDSRREQFDIPKAYQHKVQDTVNVVTSPEIEILIIHAEGAYADYVKKRMKPSDYCKSVLKMPRVKEYEYVKDYFSDINKLLGALEEYKRCTKQRKGELTIFDLVK